MFPLGPGRDNTMCGIAGFLNDGGFDPSSARRIAKEMALTLRSRGPDDEGEWIDGSAGIALAHRRLAVVDLTTAGHQPMTSSSGRYVLALNGEIYNHAALRLRIRSFDWRGSSDTEVLLAAIEEWGIEAVLQRVVGMFAFALWDAEERELFLARDRLGEKPLYYGAQGDTFMFASDVNALHAHPAFRAEIEPGVLEMYLRQGYISAPHSIYRGIHKLNPGSILRIASPFSDACRHELQTYWSLAQSIESAVANPFTGTREDAAFNLEELLSASISDQMTADVPVGAFLSGGIDSSVVVALMQALSSRSAKTFTVGFAQTALDEAPKAREIARHLGTDHTEIYADPRDVRECMGDITAAYGEPFADSSSIPTFLVSRLAREQVTVSLSGDGGDELFGGYNRYSRINSQWQVLRKVPRAIRHGANQLMRIMPRSMRERVGESFTAETALHYYAQRRSQWKQPGELLRHHHPDRASCIASSPVCLEDSCARMMYVDTIGYLPDDILVKLDRTSMASSLETRVPMLDHRVVEFSWRLPLHWRRGDGPGKLLLRDILSRYVPASITAGPKAGFGVPMDVWLSGPLRDWAESLFEPHRLAHHEFLRAEPVLCAWKRMLDGNRRLAEPLWVVLMFEDWQRRSAALQAERRTELH